MATGQHWNVPTGPQGAWAGGRGGQRGRGNTSFQTESFYDFWAKPSSLFSIYIYIHILCTHTPIKILMYISSYLEIIMYMTALEPIRETARSRGKNVGLKPGLSLSSAMSSYTTPGNVLHLSCPDFPPL